MVLYRAGCFRRRRRLPAASSARWCRRTNCCRRARALAKEIAAKTAPVSVALIRQMMWRMFGADDPMEAHKVDSRGIYSRGRSADVKEGVVSFLEKRSGEVHGQGVERHAGLFSVVGRAGVSVEAEGVAFTPAVITREGR